MFLWLHICFEFLTTENTDSCRCQGDPHCYSFDGFRTDFQGKCTYTMVRDQCSAGVGIAPPKFEVVGDFIPDSRGKPVARYERAIIRINDKRKTVSVLCHLS